MNEKLLDSGRRVDYEISKWVFPCNPFFKCVFLMLQYQKRFGGDSTVWRKLHVVGIWGHLEKKT